MKPKPKCALQKSIEESASTVWGSCNLFYDGDCFDPFAYVCTLGWASPKFISTAIGKGNTPQEAIENAIKERVKVRKEEKIQLEQWKEKQKELEKMKAGKVRVKKGWAEEGRIGKVIGMTNQGGQPWIGILWDGEEDPDWIKEAALENIS